MESLASRGSTRTSRRPTVDSIAANGVRFTNGYVSGPYCSPTRAGLMTGRYQTRFGHEFNRRRRGGREGVWTARYPRGRSPTVSNRSDT
jgi:arylsulfatase A-like enzyme